MAAQSADRENDRVRSIDEYLQLRYHTSAVRPTFAMLELELDIPDDVYSHPALEKLRDCALFSISISNVGYDLRNVLLVVCL